MKKVYIYSMILILFMFFSLANLSLFSELRAKQITWYLVGFFVFFIVRKIRLEKIIKVILPIYIVLNILLLYLLFFGNIVNGSKAWLNLGFCSFQPSEFMKITLIILLSYVASSYNKYTLKCILLTLIPSILTFLEPDTGNVLFYFVICGTVLLMEKENRKRFLVLAGVAAVFLVSFFSLYFFARDVFIKLFGSSFFYRMDRIVSLFSSSSYQLNTALLNMGASGLWGIKEVTAIPEAETDFAFSLLVSLNGFIGSIFYLGLNFFFIFLLINDLKRKNGVMKKILFSFLVMLIIQESIHILMNIGLFPITGITLPFISYGGTSLLATFLIMGIVSKDDKGNNMDYNKG